MATTTEDVKVKVSVLGLENLDKIKDKTDQAKASVNGLATAILGVGFASFINNALQAADRISDFSQATNISIASLKALESAMNQSGGSGKNLEKSINTLYQAIETANNGSLAARDAFAKVGISLDELRNASETDILQKTLEGLAQMPPGAERAAVATQLLSRSFRGIDPKQLLEALDTGKYADAEEAIAKAAEANQKLENSFKTLQEGAIQAIQPIIDLMGSKELTSDTAAKIITGIGIALGVAFGASAIANVIAIGGAIRNLNVALKGTAVVQAGLQALQGPKGWAVLAGSAVATAAAVYGLNKLLEETETTGQAAADAVKGLPTPSAGTGKITAATPSTGSAGRQQELDARQKAVLESNRRIAQSTAEINKLNALKGASDVEKINAESAADIAKAREEIFSKENLSKTQKEKEYAAKKLEIEKKGELEIARIRQDQQSQLLQQRQSYSDTVNQLLGYEKSELQKINDQIALQPDKYKDIGDELRKNAAAQDQNLQFIKKFNEEQRIQKQLAEEYQGIIVDSAKTKYSAFLDIVKTQAIENASSKQEAITLGLQYDYLKKMSQAATQLSTYKEYMNALDYEGEDLSQQQSEAIARHIQQREKLVAEMEMERDLITSMQISEFNRVSTFDYAWQDAFKKYKETAMDTSSQVKNSFENFTSGMEDALTKFVMGGKLSFKDLAQSILADLARIAVKRAIVFAATRLFGIPMLAEGGPTMPNQPYIVGEKGPELFVPKSAGTVVPNSAIATGGSNIGMGATTVNYNIQAVDAASFRSLVARDPSFIYAVTEQGRRSQPTRSR